jgi:hypothetical protein
VLIEPDREVVQSYPRCQTCPQTCDVVRPLPPEAEGVEELVVDTLDDLRYSRQPSPQTLGPASLAGVAGFAGRMDDVHPVVFEPPPMVLFSLEALESAM